MISWNLTIQAVQTILEKQRDLPNTPGKSRARIQLIRMGRDAARKRRVKRLDMAKSAIRDKVSRTMSNDELDRIFETDGFLCRRKEINNILNKFRKNIVSGFIRGAGSVETYVKSAIQKV